MAMPLIQNKYHKAPKIDVSHPFQLPKKLQKQLDHYPEFYQQWKRESKDLPNNYDLVEVPHEIRCKTMLDKVNIVDKLKIILK